MAKKPSSSRWQQRQQNDPYVLRARREGRRSRASFKLEEIQASDRVLRAGATVVDLGAAPGGWAQLAANLIGPEGRIIAVDVLEMEPLAGVEIICGDFCDDAVLQQVIAAAGEGADLVMSDMAPNMSGNRAVDQPRSMYLAELALELAAQLLKPGGSLVVKLFQGEGFEAFVGDVRQQFDKVRLRKPLSSRSGNREMYLVATGHRL